MNRFREMFGFYTVPRVKDGSWGEINSNIEHATRNVKIATFFVTISIINAVIGLILRLAR